MANVYREPVASPVLDKELELPVGKGNLSEAVDEYERQLRVETIDSIPQAIGKVMEIENELGEKLTDEEFRVLCLFSELLGVVHGNVGANKILDKEKTRETVEHKNAQKLESIKFQQRMVSAVLTNLDVMNDRVPDGLGKYMFVVGKLFEDYFEKKQIGSRDERGFLRGVKAMITTAILFKANGWEVALPDPEDDLHHNTDLIVRNKTGQIYAVDVTTKFFPEELRSTIVRDKRDGELYADYVDDAPPRFYVAKGERSRNLAPDQWTNVRFLSVNIPARNESWDEDNYVPLAYGREVGIPNYFCVGDFGKMLENLEK